MADFYRLNTPTEDKVVSREQRIYADVEQIVSGAGNTVITTSTAPKQKIKFFIDAFRFTNIADGVVHTVKVGKYFELEHREVSRFITSQGIFNFVYECGDRQPSGNDGLYSFTLTTASDTIMNGIFYVSSVVFEDSFYNPASGWLDPDNPDNIIDEIDDGDEILPGGDGEGDGSGLTNNILNQNIAFSHHWNTVNHYIPFNFGEQPNNGAYGVYKVAGFVENDPWCILYEKVDGGTFDWYICVNPAHSPVLDTGLYVIAGLRSEENVTIPQSYQNGMKYLTITEDNVTVVGAKLGTTRSTDLSRRQYIDYTFGTRYIVNPFSLKYPNQPSFLTMSVRIIGELIAATNPDNIDEIVNGIKINLIHNGGNVTYNSGNGMPEWADTSNKPVYRYNHVLLNEDFNGPLNPGVGRDWWCDIPHARYSVGPGNQISDAAWYYPGDGLQTSEPFYIGYPFVKGDVTTPIISDNPIIPTPRLWYPDVLTIRGQTPVFEYDDSVSPRRIWMRFN